MKKILLSLLMVFPITAHSTTNVTGRIKAFNDSGQLVTVYIENCTVEDMGGGEYIMTGMGVGTNGIILQGSTPEMIEADSVDQWNRRLRAAFQLETSARFTNTISTSDTWTLIETTTFDPVYTNGFRYETNTMFYIGTKTNLAFFGTFTGRMAPQAGTNKKLQIGVRKNGSIVKSSTIYDASSGAPIHFTVLYFVILSPGDALHFYCRNNSGVQNIVFRTIENQLTN